MSVLLGFATAIGVLSIACCLAVVSWIALTELRAKMDDRRWRRKIRRLGRDLAVETYGKTGWMSGDTTFKGTPPMRYPSIFDPPVPYGSDFERPMSCQDPGYWEAWKANQDAKAPPGRSRYSSVDDLIREAHGVPPKGDA